MKKAGGGLLALATVTLTGSLAAAEPADQPAPASHARVVVTKGGGSAGGTAVDAESEGKAVQISSIEPASGPGGVAPQDRTWLGVGVDEGSEALAAQLGLAPGSGLVVTYLAPDSPAAKAGLEKNDVLVELDGQLLVVPAQLRKLVQVHKEGDEIKLVFYRAGKKQTATATLGKAPEEFGPFGGGRSWDGEPQPFLKLLPPDAVRRQTKSFHELLELEKVNRTKIEEQVRRSVEQARKAYHEALRASSNAISGSMGKTLRDLQRYRFDLDNFPSVTVRSTGERVKSIVKADDSGTIVVVCNPKPRLTAHDKDGKLLFDGEVDTPEQRAKVPPELWEKVEPMLDKLAPKAEEDRETERGRSNGTSFSYKLPPAPRFSVGPPTL